MGVTGLNPIATPFGLTRSERPVASFNPNGIVKSHGAVGSDLCSKHWLRICWHFLTPSSHAAAPNAGLRMADSELQLLNGRELCCLGRRLQLDPGDQQHRHDENAYAGDGDQETLETRVNGGH